MTGVVSSLYTAAITLCLCSAGILGGERSRRNGSIAWLTWFLVLEAGTFALELLMAHPDTPLKGLWLGLRLGSSLLIAPLLWLAVKEAIEGARPSWLALGRGHLVAIALGLIFTVPLIEDAHLGTGYLNETNPAGRLHARFIHATMLGCIGIFAVQAPLLLLRCRRLIAAGTGGMNPSSWLQWLLPLVATTWIFGLLRTLQSITHAPREWLLLFAVLEAGVAVGAIFILIRRWTLPPIALPAVTAAAPAPDAVAPGPPETYARSSLTPVIRERIRRKLKSALEDERLYRDSTLSLRSLAEILRENTHYLSQVLNQDLNCNFYDLINQFRVQEAKALLKAAPSRTVLEIAQTVGFNSKSTFNAAFRRHAGVTPTEFREKTPAGGPSG